MHTEQPTVADYRLLGIRVGAPEGEIKKAYRRLARENHPDVTQGDPAREARFKVITAAYERLLNAPIPEETAVTVTGRPARPADEINLAHLDGSRVVYIPPSAVHIDLNRVCYLDPTTRVRLLETTDAALKVEVKESNYHITMPRSLRHLWKTEATPRGITVSLLELVAPAGFRRHNKTTRYDRMPIEFVDTRLSRAPQGTVYTSMDAVVVTKDRVTIDLDASYVATPSLQAPVRIDRDGDQWHVRLAGKLSQWVQRGGKLGPNAVNAASAMIGNTLIVSRGR